MNLQLKKVRVLTAIFAVLLIGVPISVAASSYSGAWLPNDVDVFTIELTSTGGAGSLYMYDFDEGTVDDLLLLPDGAFSSATISFSTNGTDWFADTTSGGQALNLGNNPDFGFYFLGGMTTFTTYDLTVITPGEVYQLSADLFNNDGISDMIVAVSDAAPVPIPGTVLLLGSGLVGLVGRRIRRRQE